jgi:hypothetical protein
MTTPWTFPFGQPVRDVVQTDRTPKRVFVLGVYASAVHALWKGKDNETKVKALAVASEPCIFWRGDDEEKVEDRAEAIIAQILMPEELGTLSPASTQYNGPSGRTLDASILKPMGLKRGDAWLCDLVPHSCANLRQIAAIGKWSILSKASVPSVPVQLTDENRRREILSELFESNARVLILLGDKPIQWFLQYYDKRWNKLADFGCDEQSYGKLHQTHIAGKDILLLPLAHPRQIDKLGLSSRKWYELHQEWMEKGAGEVASRMKDLG